MISTIRGCHIYDNYDHHPMEVQAAQKSSFMKSLSVVFQPPTYSTEQRFCQVTEVYAARDIDDGYIGGRELAASVIGPPSEYFPSLGYVVERLMYSS